LFTAISFLKNRIYEEQKETRSFLERAFLIFGFETVIFAIWHSFGVHIVWLGHAKNIMFLSRLSPFDAYGVRGFGSAIWANMFAHAGLTSHTFSIFTPENFKKE
jgi:hypothetical protein